MSTLAITGMTGHLGQAVAQALAKEGVFFANWQEDHIRLLHCLIPPFTKPTMIVV